jgi:hypothetical protein
MCIDCDPMKIDFQTNAQHCGRCGHSCLGGACVAGMCQKQLLYAIDNPLAVAVDANYLYFSAVDSNVYILSSAVDGGAAPTVLVKTPVYASDIAPFAGGVGLAHYSGASLVYLDGGLKTIDGYFFQYGAAVSNGYFWWTTSSPSSVKNAKLDGTNVQTQFVDPNPGAQGLVVEGTTAYWTDVGGQKIMRGDVDATPVVVAPIGLSRSVTGSYRIVRVGNDLIWTEPSSTNVAKDGRVMRAVGSVPDAAVTPVATGLGNPQYIAYDGTYVYWTNQGDTSVSRIKGDGSEPMPKSIVTDAVAPLGIAVDTRFVYFSQAQSIPYGGGIYRVAK